MSKREDRLDLNRVALVTGATRGIGQTIVTRLVAIGAHVICVGRDEERLRQISVEFGGKVQVSTLDISDSSAVSGFIEELTNRNVSIDTLINNAGHDSGGASLFHQVEVGDWESIIDTNVKGLMRITWGILPKMIERGQGHIVNIGSMAGYLAYRTGATYCASKYAIHGFSEALRKDCADTKVRVTEIMPGLVETDFARNRFKEDRQSADGYYSRFAACLEPDDIARAVIYVLQQPSDVLVSQIVIEPNQTLHKTASNT